MSFLLSAEHKTIMLTTTTLNLGCTQFESQSRLPTLSFYSFSQILQAMTASFLTSYS